EDLKESGCARSPRWAIRVTDQRKRSLGSGPITRNLCVSGSVQLPSRVCCPSKVQLPRLLQFDARVHSPHYVALPESQVKLFGHCTRHHLRIRWPLSLLGPNRCASTGKFGD